MAPWSLASYKEDEVSNPERAAFRRAGERLARNSSAFTYETAWKQLTVKDGIPYPSSAVFTQHVWKKPLSLSLCEQSMAVADEIDGWLGGSQVRSRIAHCLLLRGDWRSSVRSPLCMDSKSACLYIEMDPMRYDSREIGARKRSDPASLYPEDISLLLDVLKNEARPVVLQISSFSAQNGNSREVIERSLRGKLEPGGFFYRDQIYVNGQMTSFIFDRGIKLHSGSLQPAFEDWLARI